MRTGYTTGACAAAAAKAAVAALGGAVATTVDIPLPDGTRAGFPVLFARVTGAGCAEAAVRKDAGDDPDVTDGVAVVVTVAWTDDAAVRFTAGEGVGTVTKPGLQIPPGEPAINPAPRRMIAAAVREATPRGVAVTVAIPGGRELAARTFNPRLGVEGGLSILGTTGRVRPFSAPALRDALVCALDVAMACGVRAPVLVPGHIGERGARRRFRLAAEQVVPVSNEWGFMLDQVAGRKWERVLLVGHPGKLAKLAEGHWATHSRQSPSALPGVARLAGVMGLGLSGGTETVEGVFAGLGGEDRRRLGDALAARIRAAVEPRVRHTAAVALIDMRGDLLGADGDLAPWQ